MKPLNTSQKKHLYDYEKIKQESGGECYLIDFYHFIGKLHKGTINTVFFPHAS